MWVIYMYILRSHMQKLYGFKFFLLGGMLVFVWGQFWTKTGNRLQGRKKCGSKREIRKLGGSDSKII